MLNICDKTIMYMDLSFNRKMSVSIRFGPVCKYTITDMYIGSSLITWCNSIRYLGVNIESGSCFKVDTDIKQRKAFLGAYMPYISSLLLPVTYQVTDHKYYR